MQMKWIKKEEITVNKCRRRRRKKKGVTIIE